MDKLKDSSPHTEQHLVNQWETPAGFCSAWLARHIGVTDHCPTFSELWVYEAEWNSSHQDCTFPPCWVKTRVGRVGGSDSKGWSEVHDKRLPQHSCHIYCSCAAWHLSPSHTLEMLAHYKIRLAVAMTRVERKQEKQSEVWSTLSRTVETTGLRQNFSRQWWLSLFRTHFHLRPSSTRYMSSSEIRITCTFWYTCRGW